MTIALYTNIVSPHQLPLARELVKLIGPESYRYIYTEPLHQERSRMGWLEENASWLLCEREQPQLARKWLEGADVLFCGHRALDLFALRSSARRRTFYFSERWFKPIPTKIGLRLPGWMRMWVPGYRRMAKRILQLLRTDPGFRYFPMGVHARSDFRCLGVPEDKMTLWGYFVSPSEVRESGLKRVRTKDGPVRLLWVGRMLDWKKVDTLIDAVRMACGYGCSVSLTLVGDGPELASLKKLSQGLPVTFMSSRPIDEIRCLMRTHDIYVLPSDTAEGWGAALCEALEERMVCFGTYEAGSSATILPARQLFHAGDVKALAGLIQEYVSRPNADWLCSIGRWNAETAASQFLAEVAR